MHQAQLLSLLTTRLDAAGTGWIPNAFETTPDNGRAVLAAIATGTITVVTLLLTLTLIAIQLAAGQLSPRTIANFLGDRFQQLTRNRTILPCVMAAGIAQDQID